MPSLRPGVTRTGDRRPSVSVQITVGLVPLPVLLPFPFPLPLPLLVLVAFAPLLPLLAAVSVLGPLIAVKTSCVGWKRSAAAGIRTTSSARATSMLTVAVIP